MTANDRQVTPRRRARGDTYLADLPDA